MKKLFALLIVLSMLVCITTLAAARPVKGQKSYNCKQIGVSKVRPFKHPKQQHRLQVKIKGVKHFGYITSQPKFRKA